MKLQRNLQYLLDNLKLKNDFFGRIKIMCIFAVNKTNIMEKQAQNLINLYNERGEMHGYWEWYHACGQLMSKGKYVNGKQDGYWEEYYSDGQLSSKGNWVNGKQDGYWEEYYSSGQLSSKGNLVNGKREGYWEAYCRNGQLMKKGNWVNGRFQEEKEQTELSMDEIAKKFGIPVNQLKIKK
jgi:antitoxin component YwqK of YwqJK toxin-antitoxin module